MGSEPSAEYAAGLTHVSQALVQELMDAPCSLSHTTATTGLPQWLTRSVTPATAYTKAMVVARLIAPLVGHAGTARYLGIPASEQAPRIANYEGAYWQRNVHCLTLAHHAHLGMPGAMLKLALGDPGDSLPTLAMMYMYVYYEALALACGRGCGCRCAPPAPELADYMHDLVVLLEYAEREWRSLPGPWLGSLAKIVGLARVEWLDPARRLQGLPVSRLANLLGTLMLERGSDASAIETAPSLADEAGRAMYAIVTTAVAARIDDDYSKLSKHVIAAKVQVLSRRHIFAAVLLSSTLLMLDLHTMKRPPSFDIAEEFVSAQMMPALCTVLNRLSGTTADWSTRCAGIQTASMILDSIIIASGPGCLHQPALTAAAKSVLASGLVTHIAAALNKPKDSVSCLIAAAALASLMVTLQTSRVAALLLRADALALRQVFQSGHLDPDPQEVLRGFLAMTDRAEADRAQSGVGASQAGPPASAGRPARAKAALQGKQRVCGNAECKAQDSDRSFEKCARCMAVAYRSRACQRAHWRSGHRAICVPVSVKEASIADSIARLAL